MHVCTHTYTHTTHTYTHTHTSDHPVEDGVVVVPLHTQLHKVPAGQGCLLGPQLNVKLSQRGYHQDLHTTYGLTAAAPNSLNWELLPIARKVQMYIHMYIRTSNTRIHI